MHCVAGEGDEGTHTHLHIATCADTRTCQPGKQTDTCVHADYDTYTYAHKSIHIKAHTHTHK